MYPPQHSFRYGYTTGSAPMARMKSSIMVGPNGIQGKVPMRMNKKEIEQLHKSADALKAVIAQIDLD